MAKKQNVVIVTEKRDPHADAVILELRKRGHQPVRLHPADFPIDSQATLEFDQQQWNGMLYLHKGAIDIDTIRSIWWRRPTSFVLPDSLSQEERIFARRETSATYRGLWSILDCYWMSYPPYIRQASNKIEQMKRAANLGFHVPRTLITNTPADARAFYEKCAGQVVYKSLAAPFFADLEGGASALNTDYRPPRCVYTTALTQEHLQIMDSVRLTPCQFQELVPKRIELRVTVIGDDIFPCEIHSQENSRTQLDWRHYEVSVPYKKGSLPPDIAEKCIALTKSYGLNYGAIDLIVTPDDQYIFLEINPNGQWLFIEQYVPELRMVEALTSYLLRGAA